MLIPTGRSLLEEKLFVANEDKFQKYPVPIASSEPSITTWTAGADEMFWKTTIDCKMIPYANALHAGGLQISDAKTDPYTFVTV